jgi:asparagine synthetase B (glutamine-hydrolysing)
VPGRPPVQPRDLQAQLRDLPRSCSDARLLLQAIVEWGVQRALSRIEGAFGFSVWDRESRVLWLARDPVGERPLYYGWYQGQFLFASEMKALQAFAGFAPSIDQDALSLLLRHDYVPAPHTIYRGIHKLVAGAMLRIDLSDHAAVAPARPRRGRATGAHAMRCRARCRNRCSRRRAWNRPPTSWKRYCRRPSPHACTRRWPAARSCPAAPTPRW